ncbi:MAG: EAL domain-containing protein [Roseiarcus sp.]|jgi:diguanylate cyclase (GGDEF)-like protein/PAS domain S-box-containing protein
MANIGIALQRPGGPDWRSWASARGVSLFGTIRGRILIAFLAMSVITAALGGYAALGMQHAGALVAKTFDESLMSINYARAAAADFAGMQAAFTRRMVTHDPGVRRQLDEAVDGLARSLSEDLQIAAERSHSARAAKAAQNVQQAVKAWSDERGVSADASWSALDRDAETVNQQIDLLVNYTAGDGFINRQHALASVAADQRLNLVGTSLAILLSAFVAWLLARRIIGPVAVASAVAGSIARGQMDGVIPQGGADELGALLAAMGVMRDKIGTMMAREVAARRSAQTRLADALEGSREGVVVVDAEGRIALANSQAANFLGGSPQLLQKGAAVADLSAALAFPVEQGAPLLRLDGRLPATGEALLRDGRWLRVGQSITQDGGSVADWSDISELKEQEEKLKATNLRLDAALDNMSQGLCLYDSDNRLKVVNRRFCEIFGLPPSRVRPGVTFREVLELSIAAGAHAGRSASDLISEQAAFVSRRGSGAYHQELGQGRVVAIVHQPMADGGWVATYEDITERRRSEARIAFMARHDSLTGLPNRVLFGEKIEEAIAGAGRDGGFSVLCLDLDRFKQVNDTLGHHLGDELLRSVAQRLRDCVRDADTVSRLGGDEFAIVQRGLQRPEDAALLARRIIELLSAPYDVAGHRVTIGASIGISLAPGDGVTCDKLLKSADVALYRAKADGRGTWRFFEAEMDARLQARRILELDLRDAIEKDEFELYYQPIYDLEKDRISGFEALLRWWHPTRGLVMPAEFIALAEEIGLIIPIGEWVLRRACAPARGWPAHVTVAVNVSASQFKGASLIQTAKDALAAAGLPAHRLELEITESVLLADNVATLAILHALRGLGIRIAMDDFGTGYSSLSYLRAFPFDKIKIDQSFIGDLSACGGPGPIVRAIRTLADCLHMRTTAEGVESYEQLKWLRDEGCHEAQGFFFSRPVPAAAIPELLERLRGVSLAAA